MADKIRCKVQCQVRGISHYASASFQDDGGLGGLLRFCPLQETLSEHGGIARGKRM
jgi:hypothetical protein